MKVSTSINEAATLRETPEGIQGTKEAFFALGKIMGKPNKMAKLFKTMTKV